MPVTFQGQTTTFSGNGTSNPMKLWIPDTGNMPANVQKAMLVIQQWANALVAVGGGGYASLTGPGETTTPGALTQLGAFTVTDNSSTGIHLTENGTGVVQLRAGNGGMLFFSNNGVTFNVTGSFQVQTTGSISLGTSASQTTFLAPNTNNQLSFFNAAGALQQTITGSRGGNAALASLLTGLATLGLIVDSTTP